MTDNGLGRRALRAMQAEQDFKDDPAVRDACSWPTCARPSRRRRSTRASRSLLRAKLAADYPNQPMRFRSSTNSEDLDGFPCAGRYESHTGDADDWEDVLDAIRKTWASAFLFRTYEERTYYGVDHESVVMPLPVHHNFPDEAANGVALATANLFDSHRPPAGLLHQRPGGRRQRGGAPEPGHDQRRDHYQYDEPGQPITYVSHSSDIPAGRPCSRARRSTSSARRSPPSTRAFSPPTAQPRATPAGTPWTSSSKFEAETPGATPSLVVKQARSNPGRGE
ncbi:MAG: PEP/pyruvate-binding domain-containing protein [Myxococcota bacterium]